MKAMATGATGQLGYDVCRVLSDRGIENIGFASKDCVITSAEEVKTFLNEDVLTH